MNSIMRRICAVAVLAVATSQLAPGGVVPPDQSIGGRSQAELTGMWWQWVIDTRTGQDPTADPDGTQSISGDQGDVFFLAGAGTSSPVSRTFTVPAGRTLFFPLINAFTDNTAAPGETPTTYTAAELTDFMTPLFDETINQFLSVDNVAATGLAAHRQTRTFAYIVSEVDNFLTRFGYDASLGTDVYPATVSPAVTDGYWIALEPLSPGVHTLHFGAENPGWFSQDIRVTLNVVPEPSSLGALLLAMGLLAARRRASLGSI